MTEPRKNREALKILFITRGYGLHAGGMERLSYELIESVTKIPGVRSKVLAKKSRLNESLLISRIRSIFFVLTIIPKSFFSLRDVDVVHIGDPVLSIVGWLIQKIFNKPVAVTVHGLDIQFDSVFYKKYLEFFFPNFSLYIPISSFVENILSSYKVKGRVIKINPGISDIYFEPKITRRKLSGILKRDISKKIVLLTTGRLVQRKGHAWFIANILPKLSKDILYVIAGTGPERVNIEQTVAAGNLKDRVILLGRVDEATLKILYNAADIFIQPNIEIHDDIEGFGLVLLEAALCEKPVFASSLQGMTDAVHDGKNGFLLTPGDDSEWVKRINEYLDEGIKPLNSARQYTLHAFSWRRIAELHVDALRSLLPMK